MKVFIRILLLLLATPHFVLSTQDIKPQERSSEAESLREQAFKGALQSQLPLKPEEVTTLLNQLNEVQKAASEDRKKDPEFLSHLQTLSLDPGAPPPSIYVEAGYVTALSLIDMTGQPWPVKNHVIGNPKQFEIQGPLSEGHILMISPLSRYGSSNLTVTLEGFATPVQFILRSGKDKVHTRYDARIKRSGPHAKVPLVESAKVYEGSDEVLTSFLQGIPPKGAQRYRVKGSEDVQAWIYKGKLYARSPFVLLSPAPEARVSSSDGTCVYRLPPLAVLIFSKEGASLKVSLEPKGGKE